MTKQMTKQVMKAACVTRYGNVNDITVQEVPRPIPGADELQIKVHASTVQSGDWRIQSQDVPAGMSLPMKLIFGFNKPKNPIFGTEVSGVVAAVGAKVTEFKVGDEVVAITGMRLGGHGEYIVLPKTGSIVPKPARLSHAEAASMPFGFTTAWHFLTAVAALKPGEQVLINGASGAAGVAAVQIAKLQGAKVTAVCSAANFALVQRLGADDVHDYQAGDILATDRKFDVILDCADTLSPSAKESLREGGRLVLLSASLGDQLIAPFRNLVSNRKVLAGVADDCKAILATVMDLAATGKVVPVIDASYPLADTQQAFRHVASRHKKGNVVIQVVPPAGESLAASR